MGTAQPETYPLDSRTCGVQGGMVAGSWWGVMRGSVIAVVIGVSLLATGLSPARLRAESAGGIGSRPVAVRQEITGSLVERPRTFTYPERSRPITARVRGTTEINLSPEFAYYSVSESDDGDETRVTEQVTVDGVNYLRANGRDWYGVPSGLLGFESPWETFEPGRLDDEPALNALRAAGVSVTVVPDDVLRDMHVRHTRIDLTGVAALEVFAKNLPPSVALVLNAPPSDAEDEPVDEDDAEEIPDDIRFTIEIWSGVDDSFPYRVSFKASAADLSVDLTYDQTPLYDRFTIVAPEGAQIIGGR